MNIYDFFIQLSRLVSKRWPYIYSFRYRFAPPHTEKIFKEYLIYDIVNMVGSVGGNLGMWIGFSFTGIISHLMKMIRDRRPKRRIPGIVRARLPARLRQKKCLIITQIPKTV